MQEHRVALTSRQITLIGRAIQRCDPPPALENEYFEIIQLLTQAKQEIS